MPVSDHLQAFLEAFIDKRHKKRWLHSLSRSKNDDLIQGMDALYRDLDERYCQLLPKGNRQQDIAFVRQALSKYRLTSCYVLSAYPPWHRQTWSVARVLEEVVGSSSTTIVSFVPGQVAYFEGHSPGDRYLCIREA